MEVSRQSLQKLSEARADDARVLLANGRNSAAYYLAGYVVECALKAVIAKNFRQDTIPDKKFVLDIYTHKLVDLIRLADLKTAFDYESKSNATLESNWGFVSANWNETSRYDIWDSLAANEMVQAVLDPKDGIFAWIKKHW